MNLDKLKKYVAIGTVVVLVLLYILTFILSIVDSSASGSLFIASLFATVTLPLIVWVILLLAKRK